MKKSRHLVFLGAGASIPLGFPGSVKLVKDFITELRGINEPNRDVMLKKIEELKTYIRSNKFSYDSESLYSCLEGYSNPVVCIRQSGPFACSMCRIQPVTKSTRDPPCAKLRSLFEEYMITKYYREEPFLKLKIKDMYNRFFSKISGVKNWKNKEPDWKSSSFDIFTTNFDYVLETYSDQVNKTALKGYMIAENDRVIFTPEEFERNLAPLRLYKLHGSVELNLLTNGTVVARLPPGIPGRTYGQGTVASKVMVYGIQKNIFAEPFFDLLSIFKKRLVESESCYVVGYSFRDPWITQIFMDVLKNDTKQIYFIGQKQSTRIPELPILDKAVTQLSQTLEEFLELPA